MKKPSYTRYKRYEREEGLVEWLIKTRHKLPRGKDGRPGRAEKLPRGRNFIVTDQGFVVWYLEAITSAWYGDGLDYDLCDALRTASSQPKTAIGKEAWLFVLDRISEAFGRGETDYFNMLADCMKAVRNAPRHPLRVALFVAYEIHWRKGNKKPKPAEVVKTASEFFTAPQTMKELESLNASLFREAKRYQKFLASQ
jgi:hypothetical protein